MAIIETQIYIIAQPYQRALLRVELTMYTIHAMAEIRFRIFSQNFGCCVETCVS